MVNAGKCAWYLFIFESTKWKLFYFQILGYQFGLSLICTQFTTAGIQLSNNLTTTQKNLTVWFYLKTAYGINVLLRQKYKSSHENIIAVSFQQMHCVSSYPRTLAQITRTRVSISYVPPGYRECAPGLGLCTRPPDCTHFSRKRILNFV